MKIISVQMSFKRYFRCQNPASVANTAVQSRPKSNRFIVILAVFASPLPPPSGSNKNGVRNREEVYDHLPESLALLPQQLAPVHKRTTECKFYLESFTLPTIPMTFKSASVRSLNFCRSSDSQILLPECGGTESCGSSIQLSRRI